MRTFRLALPLAALAVACATSTDNGDPSAPPGETGAAGNPSGAVIATGDTAAAAPATAGDAPPPHAAPDFTLPDLDGNQVTLSSFRGKVVVLEWFNPNCPFVRYSHSDGPLRDLAAQHMAKGVVWLAIKSGAPGREGHGALVNRSARDTWKLEHPILLDETGKVGHAYDARATPTMVVIDARGSIAYQGALDNAPLGKTPSSGLDIFVNDALEAVLAGRAPEVTETRSYGCSIKYAK
jgi:peroxiredoxin